MDKWKEDKIVKPEEEPEPTFSWDEVNVYL